LGAAMLTFVVLTAGSLLWMGFAHFREKGRIQPGDLYTVANGGGYAIVKILAVDEASVHVRVYKNAFATRPSRVDESSLTLGTIHDADGFGMGHVPISRERFEAWQPRFLARSAVKKEELEGYEIWKEANGGVWEPPN